MRLVAAETHIRIILNHFKNLCSLIFSIIAVHAYLIEEMSLFRLFSE